jgi:hypothetical protein
MQLYNCSFSILLVDTVILFGITLFFLKGFFGINPFVDYWWFSLFDTDSVLLCALVPIKSYPNAEADKAQILKDNKNKAGIYM